MVSSHSDPGFSHVTCFANGTLASMIEAEHSLLEVSCFAGKTPRLDYCMMRGLVEKNLEGREAIVGVPALS